MNELPTNAQPTRLHWLGCVAAAIGVFALNHWYAMNHGRLYPIVVWGAPIFLLVGLRGLVHPDVTKIPLLTLLLGIVGLALGLAAHWCLYGF